MQEEGGRLTPSAVPPRSKETGFPQRLRSMRAALEWYAEDGRYMRTRWTDYGAGTFSEAEVIIDHGQRAREALRKEDTATDA